MRNVCQEHTIASHFFFCAEFVKIHYKYKHKEIFDHL